MQNQMNLATYGSIDTSVVEAPRDLVALCRNKADAYRLTMNLSRVKRSDTAWAELLDMPKGRLSQILNPETNTARYMPPKCEVELIRLSGNTAFTQWVVMAAKGELAHQKSTESRKAELLAELAQLEQTA